MRTVKAEIYEQGMWIPITGKFHLWGSTYDEFESGPGNQTMAIIELEGGRIVMALPQNVQFIDK